MKSDRELWEMRAACEKTVLDVQFPDGSKRKYRPVRADYSIVWMQMAGEIAEFLGSRGAVHDGYEFHSAGQRFCPDVAVFMEPSVSRSDARVPSFAIDISASRPEAMELSQLRSAYFAAGTLLHWHVETKRPCIQSLAADGIEKEFYLSDEAEAETLLPGWRAKVADFFYVYVAHGANDRADSWGRKAILRAAYGPNHPG
jgi:Uma2 family endonuclease